MELPGNRKAQEHILQGVTYQITPADAETVETVIARGISMVSTQNLRPEDFKFFMSILRATTKVGIVDTLGDGRVTFVALESCYRDHFAGEGQKLYAAWLPVAVDVSFGFFLAALPAVFTEWTGRFRSIVQKVATGSSGGSSSQKG